MPNDQFFAAAESQIAEVLLAHGLHVEFQTDDRKPPAVRYVTFDRPEGKYEISIWPNDITMTLGAREQLFECYLSREWVSDAALIAAFSRRLDRFLSGGPWEEPDETEPGPVARVVKKVIEGFRR